MSKNISLLKRFKCPECGGFRFGTSDCLSDKMTGHCHDYNPDGTRCRYTWDRNTQDVDVFTEDKK